MYGWGLGWGRLLIGGLVMLLFWGTVIALVVWAIRALSRPGQNQGSGATTALHDNNAIEILKQRYARGEISREEYQRMRQDLES